MAWLPRWRLRELAGAQVPPQRFALRTKKALQLGDIPTSRPSHELSGLILEVLGAPMAAKGHAMYYRNKETCNVQELYAEMREEETYLFPKLLEIAKLKNRNDVRETVYSLLEDHAKILAWADALALPWEMMENHEQVEDGLIWEFRYELAPELFEGEAPSTRVSGESHAKVSGSSVREKFEDPWLSQVLSPGSPWGSGGGRDYLRDVPANGEARVDAMIAKVKAHGHDTPPGVDALLELAKQLSGMVADRLKEKAGEEIKKYVNEAINDAAVAATAAGGGVYVMAAKAAYDIMAPTLWDVASHDFKNERQRSEDQAYYEESMGWYQKTVTYGFPPLWQASALAGHVSQDFNGWYKRNFVILFDLPFEDQVVVRRWWNTMLISFRDPLVEPVYRSMGAGWIGGVGLASDEQVMLVAYPIAKSYGLDPRELAIALWNRSGGWSSERSLLKTYPELGYTGVGAFQIPGSSDAAPGNALAVQYFVLARDCYAIAEEAKSTGGITTSGPLPGFLTLSSGGIKVEKMGMRPETAIALDVAKLDAGRSQVIGSGPIAKTRTANQKLPIQLVVGAAASGAIYLAGLPTALILSPLAVVGYLQYKARRK